MSGDRSHSSLLVRMILLLLFIPLLLRGSSASAFPSQPVHHQLEVHGLSSCLASFPDGTALDRWLACVDSELGGTSSSPHPNPLLRRLKGCSTIELQIIQDELNRLSALGDAMMKEDVIGTGCLLERQQLDTGLSSQSHKADVASDEAPLVADYEEVQSQTVRGNKASSSFSPGIALHLCGLLVVMLLKRLWRCKRPHAPQPANTEEAETRRTPTNCVAGMGKGLMGMSTEGPSESLSAPLGRAIGTFVAEVLEQTVEGQHCLSADEVSKLLEVAMESSLLPVMGTACNAFVAEVKASFRSTFHTLRRVREALPKQLYVGCSGLAKLRRTSSYCTSLKGPSTFDQYGRPESCRGMPVTEQLPEHIPSESENLVPVCEVPNGILKAEDGRSDSEDQWLVIRKQHGATDDGQTSLEVEDACSQNNEAYVDSACGGCHGQDDRGALYSVTPLEDAHMLATSRLCPVLPSDHALQQAWLDVLKRSVHVQEQRNYLEQILIMHQMKRTSLIEEQLHVSQESNQIMKQNVGLSLETNQIMKQSVDLTRSRAKVKEGEMQEHKLLAGYLELKKTCADELVAGLCVMLLALGYGSWTYSYDRLSNVVSSCQPVMKDRRRSLWMGVGWYQSAVDSFTGHLLALTCEIVVAGRMLAGTVTILLVGSLLLRRSVSAASHAMPVSVIVVVLGIICGIGVPQSGRLIWLRRFVFHSSLALSIPLMAGLVPFASFREVLYGILAMIMRAIVRISY